MSALMSIPYQQASLVLKQACHSKQNSRWLEGQHGTSPLAYHTRAKGKWGFEDALISHDASEMKSFICLRGGAYTPPATPHHPLTPPKCSLCLEFAPGLNHVLWQCRHFSKTRSALLASILSDIRTRLLSGSPDSATNVVLGGGDSLSQSEWISIRSACIRYIAFVVSQPT